MKVLRTILGFSLMLSTFAFQSPLNAQVACTAETGKTNNKFYVGRLQFSPRYMFESGILNLNGEVGHRNYRFGGSYSKYLADCQRIKLGGEYLAQNQDYHFSSGKIHRWSNQYAFGATYQYIYGHWFLRSFDGHIQYTHTGSHHLKNVTCAAGNTLRRRLAGSYSFEGELGVTIKPWWYSTLSLLAVYEDLRYKREILDKKDVVGYGFKGYFEQTLWCGFSIVLKGEWKKSYRYREAMLNFVGDTDWGRLLIGGFAGKVNGKHGLNDSMLYGVQIGLAFGCCEKETNCGTAPYTSICCNNSVLNENIPTEVKDVPLAPELEKTKEEGKGSSDDHDEKSCPVCNYTYTYDCRLATCFDELYFWSLESPVYIPEILSIPEEG